MKRWLVVNADDFGLTAGVNRGIVRAHEHGIVTSASLMMRRPGAEEAAAYARRRTQISVGLHVDLGEWLYESGQWRTLYTLAPDDMEGEAAWQLERFRELVGRGPTHVDSHQHVHLQEPATTILRGLADSLGVPLRSFSACVRHCGTFYGQTEEGRPLPEGITVARLIEIIEGLEPGVTELGCHPGESDGLKSSYAAERVREIEVLCDPRVREALAAEEVELRSFADLPH